MAQLSTAPYKGTFDYYPEDVIGRNVLFDIWEETAREFGYEEYDSPLIEELELYRSKTSEEIVNKQLYNFVDKGGREVVIRPEITPSVARMIAAKINELHKPIRWFNIGKFYRYEKPQKGRAREFYQLNIDIFGVTGVEAELEIFQFIESVMKKIGADPDTYKLYVSNRILLNYLFDDILGLNEKTEIKMGLGRAIDNYTKLSPGEFQAMLADIGLTKAQTDEVNRFLQLKINDLEGLKDKSEGARLLLDLFSKCEKLGIKSVVFAPQIVRGFLYYTGTVMELFDTGGNENPRALFGGGRYDDLLTVFGKPKLPAFGLGWGNLTMENYMKTYNLIPAIKTLTDVFIITMKPEYYKESCEIAKTLRSSGINVEQQLEASKIDQQLKYASKKGFKWAIILGEEEVKTGVINLKDLSSHESFKLSLNQAVERITLSRHE